MGSSPCPDCSLIHAEAEEGIAMEAADGVFTGLEGSGDDLDGVVAVAGEGDGDDAFEGIALHGASDGRYAAGGEEQLAGLFAAVEFADAVDGVGVAGVELEG